MNYSCFHYHVRRHQKQGKMAEKLGFTFGHRLRPTGNTEQADGLRNSTAANTFPLAHSRASLYLFGPESFRLSKCLIKRRHKGAAFMTGALSKRPLIHHPKSFRFFRPLALANGTPPESNHHPSWKNPPFTASVRACGFERRYLKIN